MSVADVCIGCGSYHVTDGNEIVCLEDALRAVREERDEEHETVCAMGEALLVYWATYVRTDRHPKATDETRVFRLAEDAINRARLL